MNTERTPGGTPAPGREGPAGGEPPRPEPLNWHAIDAAGNYSAAYAAIRAAHVAAGKARLWPEGDANA